MTAELWAILGTILLAWIGLAGLILKLNHGLDVRLQRVEAGMAELRERMAKIEGIVEGFIAVFSAKDA